MFDVSLYIPHKPPMLLIDAIESCCGSSVTTAARITLESSFYDRTMDGVPAWIGLEYMAQTAAVWAGLDDVRNGRAIDPAFLISSRQYTAHRPVFPAGETLLIEVKVELLQQEIVTFSGRILGAEGHILADAMFTAYRPENVRDYLLPTMTSANNTSPAG